MAVRAPVARHRRDRRAGDAQGQRPCDGALQPRRARLPSTAAQRAAAAVAGAWFRGHRVRSEEHTSELQSLMRISYAVFCLKKKTTQHKYVDSKLHQYYRG